MEEQERKEVLEALEAQKRLGWGISLTEAEEVLNAMLKWANETKVGRALSLAVVDAAGVLVAFARQDGASPLTARMAINKAYSAVDWRRDTKDVQRILYKGELMHDVAWFGDSRQAPIPGGCLLKDANGTVVGAVGISGRPSADDDEDCAQTAVEAYREICRRKKQR
jgi:uncharacterized protein GlcG (DUF336 family)